MDQIANELKKIVKAGIGAVAAGMKKTQEAINGFAQKGEPIYQQAKTAVTDAADKVKQTVSDGIQGISRKPGVEELISRIKTLSQDEWEQLRGAADVENTKAPEAGEDPASAVDPMDIAEDMRTTDTADNRPEE